MVIALAQIEVGGDKQTNLREIGAAVVYASERGAQLVAFPEGAMAHFGDPGESLVPVAEPLDGPFVLQLRTWAAAHRITIVAGMFERNPSDPRRVYNTAVVATPGGTFGGCYRKLHLYDALGYRESDRIAPGPCSDRHGGRR